MLMILGIAIAVTIAAVLLLAASKPDSFRVERSLAINAPPERIFALIEDFHAWRQWSPWENRDPDLKRTYDGAARGRGAVYAWDGNSKVGSGRMEILEASAPGKILIKLDFIKPFEGHNTAEFTLTPQGGATLVSWVMHGPAPFISKLMQVFMSFDSMIGKDFESGLAAMKQAAER